MPVWGKLSPWKKLKGGMLARVQGSRPKPYRVTIQLNPFNNKQWEKVFDILSEKSIYMAKLLVGDMPNDIESVFNQAGVSLFPEHALIYRPAAPARIKSHPVNMWPRHIIFLGIALMKIHS